jgi:hypothetical protein
VSNWMTKKLNRVWCGENIWQLDWRHVTWWWKIVKTSGKLSNSKTKNNFPALDCFSLSDGNSWSKQFFSGRWCFVDRIFLTFGMFIGGNVECRLIVIVKKFYIIYFAELPPGQQSLLIWIIAWTDIFCIGYWIANCSLVKNFYAGRVATEKRQHFLKAVFQRF